MSMISSNIFRTTQVAKAAKVFAACTGALFLASCSSDTVLEEIDKIDPNQRDPMNFACRVQEENQQSRSRATALTSDFLVSTFKAYGTQQLQTVMDRYKVDYIVKNDAWNNVTKQTWDYTNVSGQSVKYWDYSAYPYRFHAIAPCPTNASTFTLSHEALKINAPYYAQTVKNGQVSTLDAQGNITTEKPEPYILAQVHRNTDGKDEDLLAREGQTQNVNNQNTTSLNREVWMPFHHLNAKIRFAVYSLQNWVTDNKLYLENLTIKVTSDNFVTAATSYEATLSNSTDNWLSGQDTYGFTGLTKSQPG
ncbi:MAG: hypothetical protein Q4B58_07255, partial [Bacteroidales bacterium]|nr:hypothetical protein [Bacteroidales bacterium]